MLQWYRPGGSTTERRSDHDSTHLARRLSLLAKRCARNLHPSHLSKGDGARYKGCYKRDDRSCAWHAATQVKCALRWHSRHGLGLAKTIGVSNLTRTGLATIYRYAHLTDQLRAPSKTWMADAAGLAKRSSAMWLTLQQLPTGSTNKEIGGKLSISELTVKSHLTRARSVLAPFAGEAGILCLSRTGLAGIALLARQTATARIY